MAIHALRIIPLLIGLLIGPGCQPTADPDAADTQAVTIDGRTFTLELALDDESRARGLMGREQIDPDGGMLFVFPEEGRLSFWMKNCLTDIDVIFLDRDGRITRWHQMHPPAPGTPDSALKRYTSGYPAQFAIELRGGMTERLDLKRGQRIELPLERLKQRAR